MFHAKLMFRGMLSSATTLLFVFVTLHYCRDAHKQIHHWFLWRKSAQDTDSFENGNSVQKKKWNQSSDIYFIENIPKASKNTAHVLQCEFFLKAPL